MNKEFQMLRKKQRFGLRKLNIGLVSVLLGFTIFGYNLASQAPVAHAASTVTTASAGSGASGSSATGVVSGSQGSNSQAASTTSSAATASQATSSTQVTVPAASQSSESANSGNETSSQASQTGTVSANHTASNTNTTPSSQTVSVNKTTSSATQARTLMMKFPAAQSRILMMKFPAAQSRILMTKFLAAQSQNLIKSAQNVETDTPLPPTTQTYDKVEQPLLYDYGLHTSVTGTRDGNTWVDKTIATGVWDYRGDTLDTIFGTTSKPGIITSNPDKYFFAAYVDFSEQYHRVILLARSQDPSDKNLYSYTIHTYRQKTSTTTIKPGDNIKEQYTGVAGSGGSKYDLIFHNYGDSFTVKLNDFDGKWGMLPVFDGGLLDPTYGSNSYKQNDTAAQTEPISFWASAIPQKTSTKVRYVDQATGKDIVQPMEISGFGYQGFKVKGEAPTVTGYHLVSKPEFLTSKASAYEDGTISPYKVGQTYDLALSDSVVIKQTVINTDGTVRVTAYYKGSRLPSTDASKVLGRESYNDKMSFGAPDGKFYTYTNRIGQVDDSYIYYYAKNSDPDGSEMRLHFIDVTGVNNSNYAPSDGPELDVDKVQTIHGNIPDNYSFTYTVPKGYDQVAASGVTGTYSKTRHDAYVYVKIDRNGAKTTIENLKHLNHAQKQAAEEAIDRATDLNTMNQAISTATTLDGDMGKLSDLTADLTNTNNYKYASDKPKFTVATDYTNADVLLDKDDKTAGQNADDATVLKLIDQINTHKSSLDGDTNLSAAETTISGLTHLNDAQRSAANQAVTNASDLTGLKTAVGNAQSVDSAMSDLKTAVNQANEAKTTNNYLQASADKQANLNSAVQNAQDVLAATGANDSANQVKDLTKLVNDAVDALDGDAINAINAALTDKKAEINGTNLTAEEKSTLVSQAQKLADDA
uniref:YSIRK-type signal peptide-containing protein n=1 Tax=Limosilactobacillus reuteri TaxID=1598 RepID=UPI00232B1ECE